MSALPTAPADRVRSFFDLRRFAADEHAGRRPVPAGGADPFEAARRLLALDDPWVQVGAIDLPAAGGQVAAHPADEFIFACDGVVEFDDGAGGVRRLTPGRSLVIPQGCRYAWSTAGPASLLFMRCAAALAGAPAAAAPLMRPIDALAPVAPSGGPLAELLTTPMPACRNHTDFSSTNGEFVCGTWDSTPYARRPMVYRHMELMHLLEGQVVLDDGHGLQHRFGVDDVFLVERGAECRWDSAVYVKKVYAIHRPA